MKNASFSCQDILVKSHEDNNFSFLSLSLKRVFLIDKCFQNQPSQLKFPHIVSKRHVCHCRFTRECILERNLNFFTAVCNGKYGLQC